jgi:hypothetical protein
MASLLEQAQLIARELRMPPAPAPAPLLHAPVETPPVTEEVQAPTVPEEPQPAEPEEMEVDTVLQTAEAESAAPAAAAPAGPTMREANRLLSESRFEEALQAFLEISRRNRLPLRATQSR